MVAERKSQAHVVVRVILRARIHNYFLQRKEEEGDTGEERGREGGKGKHSSRYEKGWFTNLHLV